MYPAPSQPEIPSATRNQPKTDGLPFDNSRLHRRAFAAGPRPSHGRHPADRASKPEGASPRPELLASLARDYSKRIEERANIFAASERRMDTERGRRDVVQRDLGKKSPRLAAPFLNTLSKSD